MNIRLVMVLAGLGAAIAAVSWREYRSAVNLGSLRQIWADTIRDADQPGMRLTRLTDAEEMRIGDELAGKIPWAEDVEGTERLERVARPMLGRVHRRGIRYRFQAVVAPMVNAFALPGGHVLVTTGMLEFVHSDDELAEVLGHEMAHVDLRHAVERHQYRYRIGMLAEFFHQIASMPFSADQELDADAEGMRLAIAGGYNAGAGAALFARMQQDAKAAGPDTPAGELAHSAVDVVVSYFRTHPPSEERARRLRELAGKR